MEGNISQTIREQIKHIKAGELFTISDFENVNNDNLVTRTLSRLQKRRNNCSSGNRYLYRTLKKHNLAFYIPHWTKLPKKLPNETKHKLYRLAIQH